MDCSMRKRLKKIIFDKDPIAHLLHDLPPSKDSIKYSELKNHEPICRKPRRMSPKEYIFVKGQVERMLTEVAINHSIFLLLFQSELLQRRMIS